MAPQLFAAGILGVVDPTSGIIAAQDTACRLFLRWVLEQLHRPFATTAVLETRMSSPTGQRILTIVSVELKQRTAGVDVSDLDRKPAVVPFKLRD